VVYGYLCAQYPHMKSSLFIYVLTLSVLFISQNVNSQVATETSNLTIGLTEHLQFNALGIHATDKYHWVIKDAQNNAISDDTKEALSTFLFPHSGTYQLSITDIHSAHSEGCQHEHQNFNYQITVAPVQSTFDLSNISFSSNLSAANFATGLVISIPLEVTLENGTNAVVNLNKFKAVVQGVDCQIAVQNFENSIVSTSGTYVLKFQLQGSAKPHNYIMIDFIDENGKATTYYHTTEL
jgi:hypothetical protein